MSGRVVAGAITAIALSGALWWLSFSGDEAVQPLDVPGASAPAGESAPARVLGNAPPRSGGPAAAAAPASDRPSENRPPPPPEDEHDGEEHAGDPDFVSDLPLYAEAPLSPIAHTVARGWGASRGSSRRGVVGLFVIVDPDLPTADLEQLARDIREYHRDAEALAARILDSEEAATYDRHTDGGAFAERHLVAAVRRDPRLGVDSIEIRGERLEP